MKKIYTTLVALLAISQFSYAQWTGITGGIHYSSGNVGIGTSTPSARLDIISVGDVASKIYAWNNSATQRSIASYIYSSNSGNSVFPTSIRPSNLALNEFGFILSNYGWNEPGASMFRVTVAGTNNTNGSPFDASGYMDAFVVRNTGNVGIGTANPLAKEHITGSPSVNTASSNDMILLERPFNPGVAFGRMASIALGSADALSNGSGRIDFNINPINSSLGPNPSSTPALTTVMSILGNGYVGIGTTNPRAKLDVTAGVAVGNTATIQTWNWADDQTNWGLRLDQYHTGSAIDQRFVQRIGTSDYNVLSFHLGNVGIGTTSPDSKLTVNGTLHSKEVKVDMNILPDYVFESSYNLLPLTDLKTFISDNHHLPEVPSAKEVEKNGLKLGEMNALLLKKVEELTLYLIKKDEQIKAIQDELKAIKQQSNTTIKSK